MKNNKECYYYVFCVCFILLQYSQIPDGMQNEKEKKGLSHAAPHFGPVNIERDRNIQSESNKITNLSTI